MKAISKFFTSQRFSIRIELRTASKDTPTSAKTASQRGKTEGSRHKDYHLHANRSHDILTDDIPGSTSDRNSFRYFRGLVRLITTSALSMAASDPNPPIAIPTSLKASTGASFIPSPTKATDLSGSAVNRSI